MTMTAYATVTSVEGSRPVVITMEAVRGVMVHPYPLRPNQESDSILSNTEGIVTKVTMIVEQDADETAVQVGQLMTINTRWQGIVAPAGFASDAAEG